MIFSSYPFIFLFLPLVFCCYFVLLRWNLQYANIALLISSLIFYGYWNINYLPILLGSIIVNFFLASKIVSFSNGGGGGGKIFLILGITFNLALLAGFKYTDFLIENLNFCLDSKIPLPHLLLPLAISFFTFQQIAFLYDTYQDKMKYSFMDYCLFVTFFPQLIAGPIVHHKEMIPQFQNNTYAPSLSNITSGLFIFGIGLFKKIVIADSLAIYANQGFDFALNGGTLNFLEAWLSVLCYTFELYFDFSGYCDMAIGIALLFNIKLPINFNSPYKALNIQDFWKRWHITLGRFLTQYLYIPLGGSKFGKFKTLRNIFIVFVLSGIWHGAGWGFVIWGFLHASAMLIHRIYHYFLDYFNLKVPKNKFYIFICWGVTFVFVNFAWVFFRAESLSSALSISKSMLGGNAIVLPNVFEKYINAPFLSFITNPSFHIAPTFLEAMKMFCILLICMLSAFWFKNSIELSKKPSYFLLMCVSFLFWYGLIRIGVTPNQEFIYFNF